MQSSSASHVPSAKEHKFSGRHLLASYFDCDRTVVSNAARCLGALREAARACRVTIVSENCHHFPNGAVTAILLLAESHASIHTYPEHNSCFVDFFSCGDSDIAQFDRILQSTLKPQQAEVKIFERGFDS